MEKSITRKNGETFTVKPMTPMRTVEAGRLLARCKITTKLNDPTLENAGYTSVALALACLASYKTVAGEAPLVGLDDREKLDLIADVPGLADEIVSAAGDLTKEIAEGRARDAGN